MGSTKHNNLPYASEDFTEDGKTVDKGASLGFHGVDFNRIEEKIVASADSEIDLSQTLPPNSKVLDVMIAGGDDVSIATGTHIGVGTSSPDNPDRWAEIAESSLDAAGDYVWAESSDTSFVTSETTIQIASTDGSGADAGNFTGTLRIVVLYAKYPNGVS